MLDAIVVDEAHLDDITPTDRALLHQQAHRRAVRTRDAVEGRRVAGLRRLLEMMRELKPPQLSSPFKRPYSIFGQRFMTTLTPAASARCGSQASKPSPMAMTRSA